MTSEDKPQQPAEEERVAEPVPGTVAQPEEELTPFVDKFIAFAVLSIPFSALLVWIQDVLIVRFSKSVTHIVLLIGIVTFLLSIGNVAKRIHRFRIKRSHG